MSANVKKIKIACLHGYNQNPEIMKKRMTVVFGREYSSFSFEYLEGLCLVDPEKNGYGWYEIDDISHVRNMYHGPHVDFAGIYEKYSKIFDAADIIIGFSQGALVAFYLGHLGYISPKKLILFSPPVYKNITVIPNGDIDKTIIIYGERDDLIDNYRSEKYYTGICDDATIIYHSHGHVIPTTSKWKKLIRDFATIY